jgi:transposase
MGRGDLSNEQWARLEPLLPKGAKSGRPPKWSKRQLIDGSAGGPERGRRGGTCRPVTGPGRPSMGCFGAGSATAPGSGSAPPAGPGRCQGRDHLGRQRGHHRRPRPPARRWGPQRGDRQREEPGGVDNEPADHGLGRSRGGLTTKLHLAVEGGQRPLSVVLTAGQGGDSPQFAAVLGGIRVLRCGPGRPRTRPDRVLADKAYSSRANRALLRCRGIRAVIPEQDDQAAHRRARGRHGGRPLPSTGRPTGCAMRWSAGSTGASGTGRWPPATTSSPSATRPPCPSPQSTSGYDF